MPSGNLRVEAISIFTCINTAAARIFIHTCMTAHLRKTRTRITAYDSEQALYLWV